MHSREVHRVHGDTLCDESVGRDTIPLLTRQTELVFIVEHNLEVHTRFPVRVSFVE
jgi:hypothetical protein